MDEEWVQDADSPEAIEVLMSLEQKSGEAYAMGVPKESGKDKIGIYKVRQ